MCTWPVSSGGKTLLTIILQHYHKRRIDLLGVLHGLDETMSIHISSV